MSDNQQDRLTYAYRQRNALAVAFAKIAHRLGWQVGRGIDGKTENDMEWRHVVYVDLPDGSQVSWHMAPDDVYLLDGLPCYRGVWNGEYTATHSDWIKLLDLPAAPFECVTTYANRVLSGAALRRWRIEERKLEQDDDVSSEAAEAILRGYAKAWAPKI